MAKTDKKQPWFKFYPSDWAGDRKLRMCSVGARGLWVELLCVMHEAEPYGHLVTDGRPVTNRQIAALAGVTLADCGRYMAELESAGVYSRNGDKTIFSRRMVRDHEKAIKDRDNGKGGGNPKIIKGDNEGVNPPDKGKDKAQKPYSKSQNPEAAAEARALDEIGLKNEKALTAMFVALCSNLNRAPPDMKIIATWLLDGIATATISTTVPPILKRKADMASLVYCDAAVREAHAKVPTASDLQVVSSQVFVIVGTLAHACWDCYSRENGGRGYPTTQRHVDGVLQDGWYHPTEFPPGYDEATGEKLQPQSEENAA